jgi:mycofactocin precursor
MSTRTDDHPTTALPGDPEGRAPAAAATGPLGSGDGLVDEDLLVEDVSIDGMCGVY